MKVTSIVSWVDNYMYGEVAVEKRLPLSNSLQLRVVSSIACKQRQQNHLTLPVNSYWEFPVPMISSLFVEFIRVAIQHLITCYQYYTGTRLNSYCQSYVNVQVNVGRRGKIDDFTVQKYFLCYRSCVQALTRHRVSNDKIL